MRLMKKLITTIIAGALLSAAAIPAHATFASSSETVSGTLSHTTLSQRLNADYTNAVRAAVAEKLQYEAAVGEAVVAKWRAEAAVVASPVAVIVPTQAPESSVSPVEPVYVPVAPVTPVTQESPAQAVTGGSADAWASSAQAQAVVQCESGGNYATNTGNGYYGAWQFDYGTWLANGGGAYASTADQATPSQQNEIAYQTYQSRGWQPWACAQ